MLEWIAAREKKGKKNRKWREQRKRAHAGTGPHRSEHRADKPESERKPDEPAPASEQEPGPKQEGRQAEAELQDVVTDPAADSEPDEPETEMETEPEPQPDSSLKCEPKVKPQLPLAGPMAEFGGAERSRRGGAALVRHRR